MFSVEEHFCVADIAVVVFAGGCGRCAWFAAVVNERKHVHSHFPRQYCGSGVVYVVT